MIDNKIEKIKQILIIMNDKLDDLEINELLKQI